MYTDIAIHVQLLKHIMYITAFGVQYINILTNILLSCNIYFIQTFPQILKKVTGHQQ